MLKERREVAVAVAAPLIRLERLLDEALVVLAGLQVELVRGREKARLPLDAGEVGLDQVVLAQAQLTAARKAIHAAHYDFRNVQDLMGLGGFKASQDPGYGDTGDTPRRFFLSGDEQPALSVVRAA